MTALSTLTIDQLALRWSQVSTATVERAALALVRVLRERGRSLGIQGDHAHAADALNAIERLAASARAVEQIAKQTPDNDGGAA